MKQYNNISGVLNINKPKGITSFGVVKKIRHKLGVKKVGHCGTLDPDATGVLLVCFGSATKKSSLALGMDKVYRGMFKLGVSTDTDDLSGSVISTAPTAGLNQEEIENAMSCFQGEILQKVPVYSAVKLKGKALYKYARKGIEVETPVKKVNVYHFKCTGFKNPDVLFETFCSSGTYVRALVRDTGTKLKCGGALAELERTRIGRYDVEESLELDWVFGADIGEIVDKCVEL